MPNFRKERMGEAIRKVVSERIVKYGSLIPNAVMTINKVDVAPDFGVAKIFYSSFGANVDSELMQKEVEKYAPEFRHEISKKLNLRKTPKIVFCFDKNTEYAFRIDSLIGKNGA